MNYQNLGQLLIYIGLAFLVLFTLIFALNTTPLEWSPIETSIWGQYGDLIGGFIGTIVALVGVLLLFETLRQQRDSFIKQQVETRFFELLRLHRENVLEMNSRGKTGREIFIRFKDEFHELYEKINKVYPQDQSGRGQNKDVATWRRELTQIAFLILYYGIENHSENELKRKIKDIISNEKYYEMVVGHVIEVIAKDHKDTKEYNKAPHKGKKFLKYDGNQSLLGHCFRHLYQTVSYINDQPTSLLNYKEKYNYIKL